MKTRSLILCCTVMVACLTLAYDRKDYEEDAGGSFGVTFNSEDSIYGITFGAGTWIKNTPIFGDYFMGFFSNDIEDANYSNVGMTIRIMPHWQFAPFVGAGGSYNHSLWGDYPDEDAYDPEDEDALRDQGDSYWGGHAEAGFRLWLPNQFQLFELVGRYTWSSLSGDRDYWLIGISTGQEM